MHRCYKTLMVSLLVLGSIFISIGQVNALVYCLDNKTEKKEAVINLNVDPGS